MKKFLALALTVMMALCLTACGDSGGGEVSKLSFKAALSYDTLSRLNGKQVTINGYMATSSPVDGSFLYLMNMPYQSCPFCKPNTSELSNTMTVYPAKGKRFDYTTQAITVNGTLNVAPKNQLYSDDYGYEYSFKIVNAEYKIMLSEDMSERMALWQKVSESALPNELNDMFEYINFLCKWNTYYCNSTTNEDGTVNPGYYLYASDAEKFIKTDGSQYNYGYKDGYFDGFISKTKKISETGLNDLIAIIEKAKALAEKALAELDNGEYTYEYRYIEQFDNEDYIYTLNKGEELASEAETLFADYANWLASWEM